MWRNKASSLQMITIVALQVVEDVKSSTYFILSTNVIPLDSRHFYSYLTQSTRRNTQLCCLGITPLYQQLIACIYVIM
jgi:hypothetical protein